jgi:signal transduction histidine kinase
MIVGIKLCDATGGIQVGVALTAALSNALFRGNLEITHEDEEAEKKQADQGIHTSLYGQRRIQLPYRDRKTYVEISINHDEARFTIRDEGSGFDLSEKPDPQDANELETRPGRGLLLMHTLMDEVAFNDTGTEVTLVKKRQN